MNTNYIKKLLHIVVISQINNTGKWHCSNALFAVLKEFVYSDVFAKYPYADLEAALKLLGYKLTQKSTNKDVEGLVINFLKIPIDITGKGYKNFIKGSSTLTVFYNRVTKFLILPLATNLQRYEHLEQSEFNNEAELEETFKGYHIYVLDSEHNIVQISELK